MRQQRLLYPLLLLCAAGLTGCGVDAVDHSSSGSFAFNGRVHGGQQPVVGSAIQLYTVGSGGNGSAATAMLTTAVATVSGGNFTITGDYHCGQTSGGASIGSPSNQVYIVARGGNPGLAAGTDNKALVLMAALGDCSKLASTTYIEINEVTTVAAAWALAPFMTSSTNVGATATNVSGIQNAFLDAALLADTSTGMATTLPDNLSVETGKLYGLADALASCVNSDGGLGCTPLFTAATLASGTAPSDTLAAALNIVKHPGQNVAAIYATIGAVPPFAAIATVPNDWTMSLRVKGGGLKDPTALAIDSVGNVWVTGQQGPLSAFNPQGTPLSATGFGDGVLEQSDGIAIDTHDDVWVTDYNAPYAAHGGVSKFLGVNSGGTGALGSVVMNGTDSGFSNGVYFPFSIAADTNGNMFVGNEGNGTATVLTPTGGIYTNPDAVSGQFLGASENLDAFPVSIAVDTNHGFWLPDGGQHVYHLSADGLLPTVKTAACCAGSYGVATDAYGDLWVADYYGDAVSEIASDGTLLIYQASIGGLYTPQFLSVDAAQNVWVANGNGSSISEIAGNHGGTSDGVAISPTIATPYGVGGYGLDAGLQGPGYIAPDRSGNIWVSDESANSVVMFFGLAAPTSTPIMPTPVAP